MPGTLDIPPFTTASASHPWPIRALNRAGRWLPEGRALSGAAVWEAAREGTLADCQPSPEAAEALEILLDSMASNMKLTLVGRVSAKDDTVRIARTHLRLHRALHETPETRRVELPSPVFIVGWPRTGTTFLHQLMACDPASRTIPYWESFDPVPPAPGRPDRRVEKLDQTLGLLRRIAPRYDAIHPMTADSTEECVALFMNEFRTLQFDFQYAVPDYVRWLLGEDAGIAYEAYRRQLELIHFHRPVGERQVLKDPTHLVHLETLVARFPDAKFIFTHRDPVVAMSSIASLTAYTRALFTDDVDPEAVGAEIFGGYWSEALDRSRRIRAKLPTGRAVDVRHPDLRADPVGTVEEIYHSLGLDFTEAARAAMEHHLAARAAKPSGRHLHSIEGFGLRAEAVRERFEAYCTELDL